MSERDGFHWWARGRSFAHAFRGVVTLVAGQHNAWIHAAATLVVVALGVAVGVSRIEWLLLILAIGAVWTAEGLNTAIEGLCDVVSADYHPLVEKAKDVAAGAVLLAALASALVGLLVFAPRLLHLLRG